MSRMLAVVKFLFIPFEKRVKNKRRVVCSEEFSEFLKKDLGLY